MVDLERIKVNFFLFKTLIYKFIFNRNNFF